MLHLLLPLLAPVQDEHAPIPFGDPEPSAYDAPFFGTPEDPPGYDPARPTPLVVAARSGVAASCTMVGALHARCARVARGPDRAVGTLIPALSMPGATDNEL